MVPLLNCVILEKLRKLSVLQLQTYVIVGMLPDFSVLPLMSCVV